VGVTPIARQPPLPGVEKIMEVKEVKKIIKQELPQMMQTDEEVARFILRLSSQHYAGKIETENRFDRMLGEIQKDREEQSRKWEENKKESDRKWEENQRKWEENKKESDRKWEENQRKWEENKKESDRKWQENKKESDRKWEENKKESDRKWQESNRKWEENQKAIYRLFEDLEVMNRRYDQSMGALGARWGMRSEASFRNGLAGILEESFQVQVLHIIEFDDKGEVFGRPDQVELDILIKNGLLIICEIKSSLTKLDVYAFDKKIRFYEKLHEVKADRRILISPMVEDKARNLAIELGMEVYSYADEVIKK